jgi:hypothetical protein
MSRRRGRVSGEQALAIGFTAALVHLAVFVTLHL